MTYNKLREIKEEELNMLDNKIKEVVADIEKIEGETVEVKKVNTTLLETLADNINPDNEQDAYYFTFGSNHVDKRGRSLGNRFVKILGSYSSARCKLFAVRGGAWAFQYSEDEFLSQIEEFGLKSISLNEI